MQIKKKTIYIAILVVFTLIIANYYFIEPSSAIARGSGTVLSDNWFESLNWIRENTPECSVVATYWDPGHFITGIGRRMVVFDGTTQGGTITLNINGTNVTTSRIQDIATTLYTTDEDVAMNILKKYRRPGCNDMYFIASADLIGKSVWWTYFSTWNPIDRGKQYSYSIVPFQTATPLPQQNAIAYSYPVSQQQSFIVLESTTDGTLQALFQQGAQNLRVERFVYFDRAGQGNLITSDTPDIRGTAWLEPNRQVLIFMPPEIQDSMFTRMFFMNGAGLENFEFVQDWGGEIKLFKVKFDDTN